MDYALIQTLAITKISEYGKSIVFYRNGAKTGAGKCYEESSEQTDESSSLLAQTAQTRKTLLTYAIKAGIQVGDSCVIEKNTYTVTKVSEFRPGTKTLYVTLEVV